MDDTSLGIGLNHTNSYDFYNYNNYDSDDSDYYYDYYNYYYDYYYDYYYNYYYDYYYDYYDYNYDYYYDYYFDYDNYNSSDIVDSSNYDFNYRDSVFYFSNLFGAENGGGNGITMFGVGIASGNGFSMFVTTCLLICLGLPLTLGAIYGLWSQVKNGEAAPIYVINLLISDLVQFCCMITEVAKPDIAQIVNAFVKIYNYSLMVSVGFMVCIALERYQIIVHPLWYHCRRTIKSSVILCVMVWILPVPYFLVNYLSVDSVSTVLHCLFFVLPLPLILFFMAAALKALSASISVSTDEKRRIAGMLIVVLVIYLLLFLPVIIWYLYVYIRLSNPHLNHLFDLAPMFLKLSPLADLVLYIILRKGTIRQLSACVCCNDTSIVTV